MLSYFPTNFGEHFKAQLQASSYESTSLFDEEVLKKVMAERKDDSAVSASLAVVKAFTFPVFGAGKSGSQASTAQSSQSPVTPPVRGRGRG